MSAGNHGRAGEDPPTDIHIHIESNSPDGRWARDTVKIVFAGMVGSSEHEGLSLISRLFSEQAKEHGLSADAMYWAGHLLVAALELAAVLGEGARRPPPSEGAPEPPLPWNELLPIVYQIVDRYHSGEAMP